MEGAARLVLGESCFFNEKQRLQRDVTLLALRLVARSSSRPLLLLDALAGVGTSAIRALLELPEGAVGIPVANNVAVDAVGWAMSGSAIRSGLRPVARPRLPRLMKTVGLVSDEVRTFAREESAGWVRAISLF